MGVQLYYTSYPQEDETALHLACKVGHTAIITLLIDFGVDIHAENKVGMYGVYLDGNLISQAIL